jgi:hypothetical protein
MNRRCENEVVKAGIDPGQVRPCMHISCKNEAVKAGIVPGQVEPCI